jgi:hypothetical protein
MTLNVGTSREHHDGNHSTLDASANKDALRSLVDDAQRRDIPGTSRRKPLENDV